MTGFRLALILESLNPTGSYKDRGSAVLVSQMVRRGLVRQWKISSGNAGASFAAYAARARLNARVYVPESASGPKTQPDRGLRRGAAPIPGRVLRPQRRTGGCSAGDCLCQPCLPAFWPGRHRNHRL